MNKFTAFVFYNSALNWLNSLYKAFKVLKMKDDTFIFTEIEIWKPVCYGQQK